MQIENTFAALGDPTRLAIVKMLLAEGEKPAGELSQRSAISAPAVSRHLKVLTAAGLITRKVDQQRRIYAANPAAFADVNDWLQQHVHFWEGNLDRLQAAVEKDKSDV